MVAISKSQKVGGSPWYLIFADPCRTSVLGKKIRVAAKSVWEFLEEIGEEIVTHE